MSNKKEKVKLWDRVFSVLVWLGTTMWNILVLLTWVAVGFAFLAIFIVAPSLATVLFVLFATAYFEAKRFS